jgi:hypothetical protein
MLSTAQTVSLQEGREKLVKKGLEGMEDEVTMA